ncbi:hypothetical protein VCHA54P489_310025 [Vibrio chagasii]|nr:hypothetical protein VCHA54P489_310025 [Vibrio chagasii]CAH7370741.1 hypothetical protein VCHA48O429_250029 [Vibrio chagasii]CAH7430880.1 hypothetical protein VCHA49P379_90167 [Vibrio chagasii]CAH7441010.1 hypothetical protein VCHA48P442_90172 [Vibrio chagasii]
MGLVDNRVGLGAKLQVLAACIVGSWLLLSMTRRRNRLLPRAVSLRSEACSI